MVHLPNEFMFIRLKARLPVVQFQKETISRNQLTELFPLRVVPLKVRIKGRTLIWMDTLYIDIIRMCYIKLKARVEDKSGTFHRSFEIDSSITRIKKITN